MKNFLKNRKILIVVLWVALTSICFLYSFIRQIIDTKQLIDYNGLNIIIKFMGFSFIFLIISLFFYMLGFAFFIYLSIQKIRDRLIFIEFINSLLVKRVLLITISALSALYAIFFMIQISSTDILEYNQLIMISFLSTIITTLLCLLAFIPLIIIKNSNKTP